MNKRFFNQQNLTRRLRLLSVMFAMLLMPLSGWAQTEYGISVAGVQVTEANADGITSDLITGTGNVTYDVEHNTLKLNNVNISGFIVSSIPELTVELTGTNTLSGSIEYVNNPDSHGNLNITGTGSLAITGQDGDAVIRYFADVTIAGDLYIQTNTPGTHWENSNCYRGGGTLVSEMTITPTVYYPIWVLSNGVSYIQVSDANKDHVLGDNITTVTYNSTDEQLILNGFVCSTTGGAPAIYLGDQEEFKIYLSGDNTISSGGTGDGVYFNREVAFLTVSTDKDDPGKLTLGQPTSGNYSLTNVPYNCVIYENGLGFYNNTVSTVWPRLVIGNTQIMGTTENVTGYENVSFDAGSNTLTLSGAVIEGDTNEPDIDVYVKDLIVAISGTNTVNGRFYGHYTLNGSNVGTIHFTKVEGGDTPPSITISGDTGDSGPVYEFSQCTWDNDLYLTEAKTAGGVDVPGVYYGSSRFTNGNTVPKTVKISTESSGVMLWIGETAVTSTNAANVFSGDNILDGKVSVTFGDENKLILDASETPIIDALSDMPIVSALPNFTISFKGSISLGRIVSTNSAATLTFELADGADESETENRCSLSSSGEMPWQGFSGNPVFNDKLVYLPNNDSRIIQKLMPPSFSMVDGLNFSRIDDGYGTYFDCYYSIHYEEGGDVETTEYNSENPETITIETACTVTAHVEFTDVFGNTTVSDDAIGKYFEVADNEITLTSETQGNELLASSFVVSPPIAASDVTLSINYSEGPAITYDSGTGKATIAGIGLSEVGLDFTPSDACPFEILNSDYMATANVTVVPPAPTFSIPEKEELLDTDKVGLVMPEILAEDENASIRYSWVETEADGTPYSSESKVSLNSGTGTLYAWVRWASEGDIILSEKVSHTFENVKSDINQLSVKDLLEESPVYQAAAISVPFTLYNPKNETTTIGSDNYDVIYEKYVGGDTGYETVESIVNVGTYIVSVKGKGNTYGGEKLIYEALEVTQAKLGNVTIAAIEDQVFTGSQITPAVTVTFNGKAVSTEEYDVVYGENKNVGEGIVTLTSKDKNFVTSTDADGTTKKTETFKINPPVPVIAYDNTKTYLSTDKIEISLDATYAAAASGSNTIYYSWDENPTTGTAYPEGGVAAQNGTLTAWVVATVSGKNYESAKATQEFTILTDPELVYMQEGEPAEGAEYTIGAASNPSLPTLDYPDNVAVTYASNNTDVATVATDGTVTVVGVGEATITATSAATDVYAAGEASYTLTVKRQLTVSFASNKWATYYGTENLATPMGLQAYIVTGVEGPTVNVSTIGYIPANTAVLLKVDEGEMVAFSTVASAYEGVPPTFGSNQLMGSTSAVEVSTITGGTVYVLYKDMFKRASGGTIPANRGYLVVASSGNAPELSITIGDDTTGIDTVGCDSVATDNEGWFTLDGQKLQQAPTRKGLYIKNGKKVVINKK